LKIKILIPLCLACAVYGGNLAEIIALAQSAKQESLSKFNKNTSFDEQQNKRLNISFDGRYTFVPGIEGGYMTKAGSITAKIEYLLFDGGASEAANKILAHSDTIDIYKNEELANLTAFQIGKIYFNAVALDSLIALEEGYIATLASLLEEAQFFYEYNEIGKDEFDALNFVLAKHKSELEELNLKRTELRSRINLLSNGDLDFVAGSKVQMPDFSKEILSAKLAAARQDQIIKEQQSQQEKSKLTPKVYLKDSQGFSNDSFKKGDKSGSQMLGSYADANRPMLEFQWSLPDSLAASRQSQIKRIEEQKAALELSDEESMLAARLGGLESKIKRLTSQVQIAQLKQDALKQNLQNFTRRYQSGAIKYGEFLFLLDKNFSDRLNFILDSDELEITKLEYFYERAEDVATRIKG